MKAIILFSGGVDSTVLLALALQKQRTCLALSFDYGQRHRIELEHAKKIAQLYRVEHAIVPIYSEAFSASALVNGAEVERHRNPKEIAQAPLPNTYVPGRNILFLAYALGVAEVWEADEIYIGSNKSDYIPYPDCRPAFFEQVRGVARYATDRAANGNPPEVLTPLIEMDKSAIFALARELKIPLEMTFSCYTPVNNAACGSCDACMLRP